MRQYLVEGDTAPAFAVTDVDGHTQRLDDYDKGYIMLAFLRYSGCPFCNLAIHRLAMEYHRLQQHHCQVLAFVQSHKADIQTNISDRHALKPGFPIIADPAMHVYEQYGVSTSVAATLQTFRKLPYWVQSVREHGFKQTKIDGKLFLVPAYFLIEARSKRIVRAHYGSSFYDHETFTNIYQPLIFNEV